MTKEYYGGAWGANLTELEGERVAAKQAMSAAQRLEAGRYWLEEATDAEPIGSSGRRYRINGQEYRVAEEFLRIDQDPKEIGAVYYILRSDGVQFLRPTRGRDAGSGLDAAARGHMVAFTPPPRDGIR